MVLRLANMAHRKVITLNFITLRRLTALIWGDAILQKV